MEYILSKLLLVPDYIWQMLAFLLPSNKLFKFLFEKLGYISTPGT